MKRRKDVLLLLGTVWMVGLVGLAIVGSVALPDTLEMVKGLPTHSPPGAGGHVLGTDELGRDLFARLARAGVISLSIGLVVQLIVTSLGVLVGVLGEFGPKWVAVPLLRLTDAMFAFPDILLAILIVGVLNDAPSPPFLADLKGVLPVVVALSVAGWPSTARIVKTQCASLRDREFVVSARAAGASVPYLVMKHILPQLTGLLLAISVVELSGVILSESTLSFLGIGVRPPTPTWGGMINAARQQLESHPRELVWPCLALTLTIVALNFIGDGLRDRFDPKRR